MTPGDAGSTVASGWAGPGSHVHYIRWTKVKFDAQMCICKGNWMVAQADGSPRCVVGTGHARMGVEPHNQAFSSDKEPRIYKKDPAQMQLSKHGRFDR